MIDYVKSVLTHIGMSNEQKRRNVIKQGSFYLQSDSKLSSKASIFKFLTQEGLV